MGIKDLTFKEIERVPEKHLPEALDFIHSLEEGKTLLEELGMAIASETPLNKDWLRPEESKG